MSLLIRLQGHPSPASSLSSPPPPTPPNLRCFPLQHWELQTRGYCRALTLAVYCTQSALPNISDLSPLIPQVFIQKSPSQSPCLGLHISPKMTLLHGFRFPPAPVMWTLCAAPRPLRMKPHQDTAFACGVRSISPAPKINV